MIDFSQPVPARQTFVLSYLAIRRSLGMLGFLLPLALGPVGYFILGIPIQENMSSYYHTGLRDVFVGIVCAIGLFLFCYRGADLIENWTGNFACFSAIGLALCPIELNSDPLNQSTIAGFLHSVFGAGFFLTLAVYSLVHFPRSSQLLAVTSRSGQRDAIYRATGLTILGSMILMGFQLFLAPADWKAFLNKWNFIFWMEWITIWAFSLAWLTKGHAILARLQEEEQPDKNWLGLPEKLKAVGLG